MSSLRIALGCVAVAAIGAYDGIFGPGTGMFLIMAFTAVFSQQFLQSAAMAKVVNTATNLGAQIGTKTVFKGGSKLVRIALLLLVVVLCAKLLQDQ